MRRFGSIFPFLETGRRDRHMGRLVANHDFAKAVLRHGAFDEFVFGNSSASNLKAFAEAVEGWSLPDGRTARVRCVGYDELQTRIRRDGFEVFHLGGWGWFMGGLHAIRARHARAPWPITAVTHSLNGRDVIDHAVRLSHAGMAPYDAIFCTSRDGLGAMRRLLDGGAAIAGRRFEGQLIHLPLGIDEDLLDAGGDRARGRAKLRIPPDAVVLLALGRMTPAQKMDLGPLCRVVARDVVPRSVRPVVLLLAGGATPQELKLAKGAVDANGLADRVRLYANFPTDQKADLLAASDVLVSPVDNTQETFGLSLLEAMAAGLPVVASRFDGYKDLVEDGVDGFLVDTWWSEHDVVAEWFDLMDGDVAQLFQAQSVAVDLGQLADRLVRLVGDVGLRERMGAAGRAKVCRDYTWQAVVRRYENAWAGLRLEAERAGVAPAGANLYNLGPTAVFAGYSARRLEASTRVRATTVVVDEAPFNETAAYLPRGLLTALLERSAAGVEASRLVDASGAPTAQAWFALQWLLKYGMLRVEDEGEGRTVPARRDGPG